MQKDKLFFIHIPRTSGTSMTSFLRAIFKGKNLCEPKNLFEGAVFKPDIFQIFDLATAHVDFVDCLKDLNNFEYLTILREPIDRYISHYYWQVIHKNYHNYNKPLSVYMEDKFNQRDYNSMVWQLGDHFKMKDRTISVEECLSRAKINLTKFKYILFYENLEKGIIKLRKEFGIDSKIEYPNVQYSLKNSKLRKLHKQNLDPVLVDTIKERNKFDVELYNHAKELFND